MIFSMQFNQVILCAFIIIVISKSEAQQHVDTKISRIKGNILRNITGTQEFEDHIVTSSLDNSMMIRMFYRGFREFYNRLVTGTGERHNSERFQRRVPNNVPFPCDIRGFKSQKVPKSVHQLRPGGKFCENLVTFRIESTQVLI